MKKNQRPMEFTNLVFADWMLPGEWETLEVVSDAKTQRTSYVLKTKLHPSATKYIDFWGTEDPYGPGKNLVFIVIHELRKGDADENRKHRWVVTTGRNSHSDMSTTKFFKLDEAVKFAVSEMIKTTKKFDKINKRKTPQWDYETIIARDPSMRDNN